MTHLFIADLHLSPDHPRLVRGFLDLLNAYQDKQTQLYILGDWFNAWIGDDYTAPWLDEIVVRLKQFTKAGNQVYFLAGNRDFALGQDFLKQFSGQLLPDVQLLNIAGKKIRIEHGDALCTDDVGYQRFRKFIRQPWLISLLRKMPLSFRARLAQGFRKKSHEAQQFKSYEVMDVNQSAVKDALKDVDLLIHGHTHRANIHDVDGKKRIVLGDWKEDTAQILELTNEPEQEIKLKTWSY
ncbi:UDP-2,3-diacylglucosamine diphosphatase [Acinetobacter sp. HR7]|uniref:UDP-2,3-diacylglucosamine diphosphatase n=1 Tax=Acinetobacter sp. HR7 TaxID=1509403 RepID=UPI000538EFAF|nr:UDP-2,3-diacylglucosamine diphosphatase [Acinetobacter sp. HR7]KGT46920.1 UDP-2,3-diacylglucosamine hydrolase [Acinetobacter sp. HR7]